MPRIVNPGTYINATDKVKVGTSMNFTAYVITGVENFNLRTCYRAVVSGIKGYGSVHTGYLVDNFNEAMDEALHMLPEIEEEFQEQMKEWKKQLGE